MKACGWKNLQALGMLCADIVQTEIYSAKLAENCLFIEYHIANSAFFQYNTIRWLCFGRNDKSFRTIDKNSWFSI